MFQQWKWHFGGIFINNNMTHLQTTIIWKPIYKVNESFVIHLSNHCRKWILHQHSWVVFEIFHSKSTDFTMRRNWVSTVKADSFRKLHLKRRDTCLWVWPLIRGIWNEFTINLTLVSVRTILSYITYKSIILALNHRKNGKQTSRRTLMDCKSIVSSLLITSPTKLLRLCWRNGALVLSHQMYFWISKFMFYNSIRNINKQKLSLRIKIFFLRKFIIKYEIFLRMNDDKLSIWRSFLKKTILTTGIKYTNHWEVTASNEAKKSKVFIK